MNPEGAGALEHRVSAVRQTGQHDAPAAFLQILRKGAAGVGIRKPHLGNVAQLRERRVRTLAYQLRDIPGRFIKHGLVGICALVTRVLPENTP